VYDLARSASDPSTELRAYAALLAEPGRLVLDLCATPTRRRRI